MPETRQSSTLFTCALSLCFLIATMVGPALAEQPEQQESKDDIVRVAIKTSLGDIVLELNKTKAPITVKNFLDYADQGFYDSTIFHRVMPGFIIQGGGFTADMQQKKTDQPIINEWKNGLKNDRYSIAMARRGNMPNSATSQFYINLKNNYTLDQPRDGAGYAVFGKVVEGMKVVNMIGSASTTVKNQMSNVPKNPIFITKVVRLDETDKDKPNSDQDK